jgi:hypothetical protein
VSDLDRLCLGHPIAVERKRPDSDVDSSDQCSQSRRPETRKDPKAILNPVFTRKSFRSGGGFGALRPDQPQLHVALDVRQHCDRSIGAVPWARKAHHG